MDFQFVLPARNSDLLNSSGDCYIVKQIYAPNEIDRKLLECRQLCQNDPFYIFEHFDTYFTVLEMTENMPNFNRCLTRSFDLLFETVKKLEEMLSNVLVADITNKRGQYLNLTKMAMFLLVSIVRKIDQVVQRAAQLRIASKKQRGKNQVLSLDDFPNWEVKRPSFLILLYNIMQCPLEKLWSPPVAEENFVNFLCDICYRTLELTNLPDHVIRTVFQIFGTAIKRYNHAFTFPVRILQILRNVEHATNSIAEGIHVLHEEYNINSIFSVLIKDIIEALSLDSADTVVSRNFSNFLTKFSTVDPILIIPHLSTLGDELLNCESHVLRNCILQIMGEAIISQLTSECMSEDMKKARDEFLENLLCHINDVSAHVRSKALQIWNHMKEENAVPLAFQVNVLSEAVNRLEDKSSLVRKQAVQLIKSFLERNPFSAKLTLDELWKQFNEENEKLKALTDTIENERKHMENINNQWDELLEEIMPLIEESLQNKNESFLMSNDNVNDLMQASASMLLEKNYKEAITLARKADYAAGNYELTQKLSNEEECTYFAAVLKSYLFVANGCKDSNEEFGKQIKTVQFLQDSINFSKVVTKAVPKLQEYLLSKTNSDVLEAVDLFTTGYLFGIKGTESGMQLMLHLVWSSDKEKRDAVSNAYKRVLFDTSETGRLHAIKVTGNIMRLLRDMEYDHYLAMECLIHEWVSTEDIDTQMIHVLYERFTMKLEGTTPEESRLALQLLIMASTESSKISSANIHVIEAHGFDERGRRDPRIFTQCLELLLNSIDANDSHKYYKRYDANNTLVQKILNLFKCFIFHPRIPDFDRLAMKTLEFVYQMCQCPDVICQGIITDLLKKIQEYAVKVNEIKETHQQHTQLLETSLYSQQLPESQQQQQQTIANTTAGEKKEVTMPAFILARFIFCIGYMTLKEMIFLDIDVYNNMKYRQELTECIAKKKKNLKAMNNANTNNGTTHRRRTALNISAMESLRRLSNSTAEPQQEPDEDLVGATAEDNIAELINHICENVLLKADNAILKKIYGCVFEICKYPNKYKDAGLQQAANLTLIRFMCISSEFCQNNIQFLMNILQKTDNVKIKCNIIIGLSDLTFRFPNVIEPWTRNLYLMLHEQNTEIRLTSVKMLSHLILHEMVLVKAQIADLAICIVDQNEEIKERSQQFFKEIANKSNILYNVLPDIISKLSDMNVNLEEEKYHIIMRYILGLIQKDRQVETLVEKLCARFTVTREERQWRDIAYCLSLLTYNERSMRKLIDNLQHYKDKVQYDEVYQSFKTIISNANKMAKQEFKLIINEFETKLNECLEVRDGNASAAAANSADDTLDTGDGNESIRHSIRPQRPKQINHRGNKQRVNSAGSGRTPTRNRPLGRSRGRDRKSSTSSTDSDFEERQPQCKTANTTAKSTTTTTATSKSSKSKQQQQKNNNVTTARDTSGSDSDDLPRKISKTKQKQPATKSQETILDNTKSYTTRNRTRNEVMTPNRTVNETTTTTSSRRLRGRN